MDPFPCPNTHKSNASGEGSSKGQEHLLPIANVGKIMKQALPPTAKISKEAKETMQECASEFIGFVTGEASERCRKEKRKTVNGDDIVRAFKTLGLDQFSDAMQRYLYKYREHAEKSSLVKNDKSIQIDVRDELSIVRRNQYSGQYSDSYIQNNNEDERSHERFF